MLDNSASIQNKNVRKAYPRKIYHIFRSKSNFEITEFNSKVIALSIHILFKINFKFLPLEYNKQME